MLVAFRPAECSAGQDAARVDFESQIRPLLSDRCLSCHGPDSAHREADLRLDDYEQLTQLRDGQQVIQPGNAASSLLVQRIEHADDDLRMPPPDSGKQLSAVERSLLRAWIDQGAHWEAHWAYQKPERAVVPGHSLVTWRRNWVDDFVAARLQTESLMPSPDAPGPTLLRRLHFNLTGLPPSGEVADQFLQRPDQATWSLMVDRLLESDACAERLAMMWLDLVRYADTVGYHGDQDHNISPYRDWVIDAFSRNLPFDQFTREQLAGDLLPGSTVDQTIASGYNRLLQTTHEGGLQPAEYIAIYAADRVRNVSAVWMGATVGCAQCHDHKFDPYTARDFYALSAFFADIDDTDHFRTGTNALPTTRAPEQKVLSRHERLELARLQDELAALPSTAPESSVRSEGSATPDAEIEGRRAELQRAVKKLNDGARLTMITSALAEPRVTRILPRGNWLDQSGPVVQPAVPEFLGRLAVPGRATRLDLANWLVDAEEGVGLQTARVMVNRLWALMFGEGISRSLEDFGGQGVPPTHPELLDSLAVEFVESGWDIRHMLRLLAHSRTYQQSSDRRPETDQRDPGNRWLARQAAFRLPAEMIRDNALAVSGLLIRETGGASVRPYQPEGYYRHLNFPVRTYVADTDSRQWRRGIYVHWQRQFLHPMLRAFDAPSREECTARRARSNTPLAALALLNDPTFVEAARVFAARLLQAEHITEDRERLALAFRDTLSRPPDAVEQTLLLQKLAESRSKYQQRGEDARSLLETGLAPTASLPAVEHAAWTDVARVLLNLDETITRY